eukprot:gene4873-5512_t
MRVFLFRIIFETDVYNTELEDVEGFDGFHDFMKTFELLRGKKTEEEDDEIRRFSGKFKGNIRVWKDGLPNGFDRNDPKGTFYKLPSNEPIKVLVRVYVIRCLNLLPTDPNGKADPYLVVSLGKKTYKDNDNYVSKQLSPEFGRVFEFEAKLPFDNMLTVQVYDWDLLSSDDLIGETSVDIENLFYSKHRATCGIQENYVTHGYAKWRDPHKPSQILTKLCKDEGLDGPYFDNGVCTVEGNDFQADGFIKDFKGREKASDEPCALEALKNFHTLPRGYKLVPEYVETRSLVSPEKPGLEQGRIQFWTDIFPMDLTMPGPAVDIAPRKPTEYELRLIVWNTDSVVMDEVAGRQQEFKQETDVHYRSTDGSGMFNWRFVFQFMLHKAEEKIVTGKRWEASMFAVDLTEEKHPPNLYLQVWDADLISADDFLGDFIAPLTKLPSPAKSARSCDLKIMTDESKFGSIIKAKHMKGWWPFQANPEDDDDPNPVLTGKVEVELELLTKEDAEATPAGKGREEPQPLSKPNRPSDSMSLFMSPLKMLKYFLWDSYKWVLLKFLVVFLLLALMGLFFYSMPCWIFDASLLLNILNVMAESVEENSRTECDSPSSFSSGSESNDDIFEITPEPRSPNAKNRPRRVSERSGKAKQRAVYSVGRPPWYDSTGQLKKAFMIGLCGGSASGKTTVAKKIISELGVPWVLTPEQHAAAERNEYNFDHPAAFDFDLAVETLKKLKEGRSVQVPIYDFSMHSRLNKEASWLMFKTVYGANVVIFEGIMTFASQELIDVLDLKVFVDTDSDLRLARRLKRDISERGRDIIGVLKQYDTFVKPMFEQYIAPSMKDADIVVPWAGTNTVAINLIVQHVRTQLEKRGFNFRSKLVSAHQGQPLPDCLHMVEDTPQHRGLQAIIRDRSCPRDDFVFYSQRLMRILIEKAVSLLPFKPHKCITGHGTTYDGVRFAGAGVCGVSILRAGEAFEDALVSVCKDVKIGKILIQTNKDTQEPEMHYLRLPKDIRNDHIILMDATVASGAAALMAIRILLDHDVKEENIMFVSLIMGKAGVHSIAYAFPKVKIVTTAVDPETNDSYHIIPGIGSKFWQQIFWHRVGITCTWMSTECVAWILC